LEGTAGWFYDKMPGFLNVACYKFLEDVYHDPTLLDQYRIRDDEEVGRKRKTPPSDTKDGVHAEPIEGGLQAAAERWGSGLRHDGDPDVLSVPTPERPSGLVRSDGGGEDVLASSPSVSGAVVSES
jgi:hypothetical protein